MKSHAITICLALAHSSPVLACDVAAILQGAYPDAKPDDTGLIVSGTYAQRIRPDDVACKTWPGDTKLTLAAVPLIEAEPASPDESRGDVEVLVAETKTGKVLARHRETGMAFSDAIQFGDLTLDTARYHVKAGLRAFGVVTEQYGSSRVNPYSERALWLYTYNGGKIERILDGLVTRKFSGENDGNCNGTGEETTRTVGIAKAEHETYRDLQIEELVVAEVSQSDDVGECKTINKPAAPTKTTLRFENGRYRAFIKSDEKTLFSWIQNPGEP